MVTARHRRPDPVDEIPAAPLGRRLTEPQQPAGRPVHASPPARPGGGSLAVQQGLGGQAVRGLPRIFRFRQGRRGENRVPERAVAVRPGRRNPRRQRRGSLRRHRSRRHRGPRRGHVRCTTRREQHRCRHGHLVLQAGQRLHRRHGCRVPSEARIKGVAGTLRVAGPRGTGPERVHRLVGSGLVSGEGRLRVLVVRRYRLHPLTPAGPAAEGREVLVAPIGRRAGIMREVVQVVAEDLRRVVVHRHGSSLLVRTGGRAGSPGSGISSSVS